MEVIDTVQVKILPGPCTGIEYVRVFKSLVLTEVNALYTYDTHQFEAL